MRVHMIKKWTRLSFVAGPSQLFEACQNAADFFVAMVRAGKSQPFSPAEIVLMRQITRSFSSANFQ